MYRFGSYFIAVGILSQGKPSGEFLYTHTSHTSNNKSANTYHLLLCANNILIYFLQQDVIWNQNIKLDRMFMFALCQDVAKVKFIFKKLNASTVRYGFESTFLKCGFFIVQNKFQDERRRPKSVGMRPSKLERPPG